MKRKKFDLIGFGSGNVEIIKGSQLKMIAGARALSVQCSYSNDYDFNTSDNCSSANDVDSDGVEVP